MSTSGRRIPALLTRFPGTRARRATGQHTLVAVARDLLGVTYASNPVTVTVFNDVTPPAVTMTHRRPAQRSAGRPRSRPTRRTTWEWSACSSSWMARTSAPKIRRRRIGSGTRPGSRGAHADCRRPGCGRQRDRRRRGQRRRRQHAPTIAITAPARRHRQRTGRDRKRVGQRRASRACIHWTGRTSAPKIRRPRILLPGTLPRPAAGRTRSRPLPATLPETRPRRRVTVTVNNPAVRRSRYRAIAGAT